MSKPLLAIAIAAVTIAAVGCGTSGETNSTAVPSTTVVAAGFNDDDVAFTQGMIPHHSQAVEMATVALSRSTDPEIVDLARRIQGGQDPEIEQMRSWLGAWDVAEMSSDMSGMDHDSGDGMMSEGEMADLSKATGPEFDALFVDMMIRHHQGAIGMAKSVIASGSDPAVRTLAENIIAAQESEIAEMERL